MHKHNAFLVRLDRVRPKHLSSPFPPGSAVELLVLSHLDSDPLGAVPFICKKYTVKNVIHSGLKKPRSPGSSEPTLAWSKAMRAIHSEVHDFWIAPRCCSEVIRLRQGGAANGNQPIRLETNRTSAAAGTRR